MNLESLLKVRNKMFHSNRYLILEFVRQEIVSASYKSFPENIPRALLCRFWRVFTLHVSNQDIASLVTLESRASELKSETIGLKISIVGQKHGRQLALHHNLYENAFNVFQKEARNALAYHGFVSRFFSFDRDGLDLYLCLRTGRVQDWSESDDDMKAAGQEQTVRELGFVLENESSSI